MLTVYEEHFIFFWINTFAGAPDYIHMVAGTTVHSSVFKDRSVKYGTIVRIAPTKAHNRIGVIEKSHVYLQTVNNRLYFGLPSISNGDLLSLTFRALNYIPYSYTEICLTTQLYGMFSKILGGRGHTKMIERAGIIT